LASRALRASSKVVHRSAEREGGRQPVAEIVLNLHGLFDNRPLFDTNDHRNIASVSIQRDT